MAVAHRTPTADADLREIAFQIGIADGRPRVADRVVDELIACCNRLAELSPISRIGTDAPE